MDNREIQNAILRLTDFGKLKKPTEIQIVQSEQDTELLRANYHDIFDAILGPSINRILESFPDGFNYYQELLNNPTNKPPELPKVISEAYLNEVAIPHIYQAQTTLYGVLESLESILEKWHNIYDKAKEVHRLVFLSEQQWKADAAFHLIFDSNALEKIGDLQYLVKSLRNRKESLEKAQTHISRLVTLRTSTPTRQLSAYTDNLSQRTGF